MALNTVLTIVVNVIFFIKLVMELFKFPKALGFVANVSLRRELLEW